MIGSPNSPQTHAKLWRWVRKPVLLRWTDPIGIMSTIIQLGDRLPWERSHLFDQEAYPRSALQLVNLLRQEL